MVAMDLKFLENKIILHCIDILTRYSAAIIIKNKTKEEIVNNFFRIWVAIFGRPEQILADNGKEWCNDEFVTMCEQLGIEMNTTAAYAPFSNGICERHNGILAEMTLKIVEEVGCNYSLAVCWAVHAKNSLSNVYGFSPQQLVLGYNPVCPGLENPTLKVSQLSGYTSSQTVAEHLNTLMTARKAFLTCQNSDRLKRAMSSRIFSAYEERYFQGDKIYYRTSGKDWHGPAIVVGQVNKLILAKNGGIFIRVHPCKAILKSRAERQMDDPNNVDHIIKQNENITKSELEQNNDDVQMMKSDDDSDSDSSEENTILKQHTYNNNDRP